MHFGHFGSVDRFEPAKCIFWYRFPTEAKLWTDSNRHTVCGEFPKAYQFKIYLQSRRCNGILDRFELPHYSICQKQCQSKNDGFSVWIDLNHHIGMKVLQTVYTKKLIPFIGQIRTIENQILTCWRQRKSHGEPWHILSSKTLRQIGIYFVSISIASSLVETKNTLLPLLLS